MNLEITNYLKNALKSSLYPVIPFKDNNFISLTYDELLSDSYIIDSTHQLSSLLNANEFNKIFGNLSEEELKKTQTVQINCIISYKTLKTEFFEQHRHKKYISELTGVFYFDFSINFTRVDDGAQVKYCFDKDHLPWYARSFMSPKYLKLTPDVATVRDVDKYKSETTEQRAKIKNWKEYVDYCEDLFNKTADLTLKYEPKCFIFRYDINREKIVEGILQLYEEIENDISNHRLYNNFIDINFSGSSLLIDNSNIDASCNHSGQMNGKFPLAYSQRQSVHHMNLINSGEILAVSGPPGTGKTTLLQSIVADMVVKSALNSEKPPVIVATSANNQAVTNIIDSFSSIEPIGVRNLEKRWINGVKSFATYMPSSSKEGDAKKNGYQYTTTFNREFIQEAENLINDSILKMKENAELYFDKVFSTIDDVKQELKNELLCIDDLKKQLISVSAKINELTDGMELIAYIAKLNQSKTDAENKREEYKKRLSEWKENYEKISKFKRFFSFIPYLKKQISNHLSLKILPEEIEYFNKDITFSEIQERYTSKIFDKVKEIDLLEKKIKEVQQLKICVLDILKNLQDKKCYLNLLSDNKLSEFFASDINDLIDTKIRYIEFWLAVHINECRFLNREFMVTKNQRGKTFKNVLEDFYRQIALLSPCFVMTVYKMPTNFKCYDGGYLFDYIDLLIFDEAGQCSPEIAAPQFSLAKKAIVVGDECQIPPVYSLDLTMDITLAVQNNVIKDDSEFDKLIHCGLSCSQGSVMTAAKKSCKYKTNSNIRGLLLCEHRRCYDEIINYCNELVYDGLLIPMRNKDELNKGKKRLLDKKRYPLMGYHNISSSNSRKIGLSRVNEIEAVGIVKWLKENYNKICQLYKKANPDIDEKNILSIITPFAAQASIIYKQIELNMGKLAENITVGTVHTFQGAERNIIIFSTVYGSNDSGFFIDNNRNLMNVAVSRAKDAFWVFGDIEFLKNKSSNTASGLLYNKIASNSIE